MTRLLPALLLATPLLALAADPPKESVEDAAKRVLTTKDFPFCRKSEDAVPPWDRDWCALAKDAKTCPELEQMCLRRSKEGTGLFGGGSGGSRAGSKSKSVFGGDAGGAADSFDFSLPGLDFLLWAVLGVLLGALVLVIVKFIVDRRQVDGPVPDEVLAPEAAGNLVIEDPGLREMRQLLREARDMADRDVSRAIALLYAASLKHLEDRGLIRWDTTTTNREYVRTVRGKTPIDRPLAELVREVERAKFGHVPPVRSRFDELFQRIAPTLVQGATALVLALSLALSGCEGCIPGDPELDGRAAFNEILMSQGIENARFSMPIDKLTGDDPPVLVDAHVFDVDATVLHALEKATLAGARVLVLLDGPQAMPAWPSLEVKSSRARLEDLLSRAAGAASDAGSPEPAPDAGPADAGSVASAADGGLEAPLELPKPGPAITITELFARETGLEPQTRAMLQGDDRFVLPADERDAPEILLERDGQPFAVRWRTERGVLVFVADRRLFANGSMAVPGNARLAVAIAGAVVDRRAPAPVADGGESETDGEDERVIAHASVGPANPSESAVQSIGRSGLWAFVLQGLLAVGLFFVAKGAAFGTLRDRSRRRRREFSEHVAALGVQLARLRGSRFAASLYSAWALERLWHRSGREAERHDPTSLAHVLAPRVAEDEHALRALLQQADAFRREPNGVSVPEQDLLVIRRLGELLAKLGEQPHAPRRT